MPIITHEKYWAYFAYFIAISILILFLMVTEPTITLMLVVAQTMTLIVMAVLYQDLMGNFEEKERQG